MQLIKSRRWFSFAGGIVVIEPMVKIYLDGLWSTWHKTLEAQKPADLRLMSEKIWENTLQPMSRVLTRQTTPHEFCANVTGAFLRWEVVGILVTLVSLVAQSLKGRLLSPTIFPGSDAVLPPRYGCESGLLCVRYAANIISELTTHRR
jgi:hypothetical protein